MVLGSVAGQSVLDALLWAQAQPARSETSLLVREVPQGTGCASREEASLGDLVPF